MNAVVFEQTPDEKGRRMTEEGDPGATLSRLFEFYEKKTTKGGTVHAAQPPYLLQDVFYSLSLLLSPPPLCKASQAQPPAGSPLQSPAHQQESFRHRGHQRHQHNPQRHQRHHQRIYLPLTATLLLEVISNFIEKNIVNTAIIPLIAWKLMPSFPSDRFTRKST